MKSKPLEQTRRVLYLIEDGLLVLMLLVMIGMAVAQIFLRNMFGTSIVWGDSLVRVLVLWIGLAGAMIASRDGKHINIDVITRYLPKRATAWTTAAVNTFTAFICAMMAWFALKFVRMEYDYGTNGFAAVPVWICEAIIPLAFAVIGIRYVILALVHFRHAINPE